MVTKQQSELMGRTGKNIISFFFFVFVTGCGGKEKEYIWKTAKVTASAYNSVPYQTVNHPNLAAWGDTLVPGEKSIAVSRDLIALGLGHMTKVKIEGLPGVYLVKDKMHRKWRNRIDIYMGDDIEKAKNWGIKKTTIRYAIEKKDNEVR